VAEQQRENAVSGAADQIRISLPHGGWKPRPYQWKLWAYLNGGGKHAVEIAHRRWGKDEVTLHHTACAAHERVASYVHFLPLYSQARKALWDMVDPHSGKKRIDIAFPHELRAVTRDDEMFIRFRNGSTWQLAGSDNYNALVGTSYAGMVHSEYALSNPAAQSYFAPILMENNGWELFITTPRGKNHGHGMYQHALKQMRAGKDWFAELAPAAMTGALDPELLVAELARLQALHGDDYGKALWLQEYQCSFDAAIPGSIFGDAIVKMQLAGRLSAVPLEPGLPVHTGWDLGRTDDTTIWFFQMFAGEPRIVDCHASNLKDVPFYADLLRSKAKERGWRYGDHYLPHDARPRTLASSRSIYQQFQEACGEHMGTFRIAPRLDKQEQIQAARATLAVAWMDAQMCASGIEALQHYHREWDEEKKVFKDSPEHDWSSHYADGFMTLAVAWKRGMIPKAASENSGIAGATGNSIGAGVTFGELKKRHLRARKAARTGGF
jgi:phage terminase large subunit